MNKTIAPFRGNEGFTLIEILIALAISSTFLAMVFIQFQSQQNSYQAQNQVVEMQQSLRAGISYMTQELHMAGYDPYNSKTTGIVTAATQTIVFTYVADDDGLDNDNDATTDETGELETITFDFYDAYSDGIKDIGRQAGSNSATKRAIAEHIEDIEFTYLNANGATETNLDDIRTIQISILARTGKRDKDFSSVKTYTSASGTLWGPYNDGFRRRFEIITINLRNMEI